MTSSPVPTMHPYDVRAFASPRALALLLRLTGTYLEMTNNENLRAQVNSLKYEVENLRQDKELVALRHEKELRDAQVKTEAEFKKTQAAESVNFKSTRKLESVQQELREAQSQAINEKASFDRRLREAQEQQRSLQEDADDALARLSDQERQFQHTLRDVETKRATLQENLDRTQAELSSMIADLKETQDKAAENQMEVQRLNAENKELKEHAGDVQALSHVQRELSEQVAYIRKLESSNREQGAELRRLRDANKNTGVVEEQKRSLEIELQVMKDVERQLGESELQRELLEDERRMWTSILEREGQDNEYDTPEAVVKGLVQEQIQRAGLVDRIGQFEAEMAGKDETIQTLENETNTLKAELQKLRSTSNAFSVRPDAKALKRAEQQRALAMREVKLLREQLKTYDAEETMILNDENKNFDDQKANQIRDLETLIDQYRAEMQSLSDELSKAEVPKPATPPPPSSSSSPTRGTKRPHEDDENSSSATTEQLGPLLRKNKTLQATLSESQSRTTLLERELSSLKKQLKSLRSKPRILALHSNPTADYERVKLSTLSTLRSENAALLAQLRGNNDVLNKVKMVPISTLENRDLQMEELRKTIAQREKELLRRREFFASKADEFRGIILSALGWKVNFMKNGKAKLTSLFYVNPKGDEEEEDGEDANSILLDGERGTMQFTGGKESEFARECRDLVRYWVEERKEIPCFLAAVTIELFEKGTRAVG
ncbi:MAG: hypothetical protein Q9227_001814 [Pyrenula ochraceoflavens]